MSNGATGVLVGVVHDLSRLATRAATRNANIDMDAARLIRGSAHEKMRVDGSAGHGIERAADRLGLRASEPDRVIPQVFEGVDPQTGLVLTFGSADVHSIPLRDFYGEFIGVGFPFKKAERFMSSDAEGWSLWARAEYRTSDVVYFRDRPGTPDPITGEPRWNYTNATKVPWDDGTLQAPVYAFAHGDPGKIAVGVWSGADVTPRTMIVDGPTYGRILAANEHFNRALTRSGDRPVVMMTCSAGHPSISAAKGTAQSLWEAGVERDVYAPKGVYGSTHKWRMGTRLEGSAISFRSETAEEQEFLKDPFVHYKAPRGDPAQAP